VNQDTRASDHYFHAIEVQTDQEPYTPWSANSSPATVSVSKEDQAWLESFFSKNSSLHRDTIISSLGVDKEKAYKLIEEWIKAGCITEV
jgi:hypothetical protein